MKRESLKYVSIAMIIIAMVLINHSFAEQKEPFVGLEPLYPMVNNIMDRLIKLETKVTMLEANIKTSKVIEEFNRKQEQEQAEIKQEELEKRIQKMELCIKQFKKTKRAMTDD